MADNNSVSIQAHLVLLNASELKGNQNEKNMKVLLNPAICCK